MRAHLSRFIVRFLLLVVSVVALTAMFISPAAADDASFYAMPANTIIVIEGPVSSITVNVITIYNFTVMVASDNPILTVVKIGDVLHVEGEADEAGVIEATVVTAISATITLNGPVTAINGTTVVVNNINVEFEPDDPTLALIKVGDVLNVEGNYRNHGTTLILIVINVTFVNNTTIIVNTLPTNCKVSKNGHIKCSKKH